MLKDLLWESDIEMHDASALLGGTAVPLYAPSQSHTTHAVPAPVSNGKFPTVRAPAQGQPAATLPAHPTSVRPSSLVIQ